MTDARALIPCDGCAHPVPPGALSFRRAEGRECRYCSDCDAIYSGFVNACQWEEDRLNAVLSAFIAEARDRIQLNLVPQDLPGMTGVLANLG